MKKRKQVLRAGFYSHSDALFSMLQKVTIYGVVAEVRVRLTNAALYPIYDCEYVVKHHLAALVRTYDV